MKNFKLIAVILALIILASSTANAQWVFVARKAMGVIHKMQGQGNDIATVILEAPADKVYGAAMNSIKGNDKLSIVRHSDKSRTIEFSDGGRTATIKVNGVEEKLSEIVVSSGAPGSKADATPLVVDGILMVCKEMKAQCRVSEDESS